MFRASGPRTLPADIAEDGKADGIIHLCEQAALEFGSNRREPTFARPVVAIKDGGPGTVVLPCTTKQQSGSPDFYELTSPPVVWTQPKVAVPSYASYRYEVVPRRHFVKKIGLIPQGPRIDLLNWLISRY
jgi:hypothetical protein